MRHTPITTAKRLKRVALSSCAAIALLAAAPSAFADEAQNFDIPAQDLAAALTAFARQSDREILFSTEAVQNRQSPGVEGELEPEAALAQLLTGTGLEWSLTSEGALLVNEAPRSERSTDQAQPYQVASLAQDRTRDAGRQPVPVAEDDEDEGDEANTPQRDVITVTGTSIRGVYPDSAPLEVYTSEDIALSGATTVNRFLETLPQNLNSLTAGAQSLGPGDGDLIAGGGIDLRGLGVGTTLVLLDGRRLTAPSGGSPDTSLIPLGAIERVEVLPDGASAIYGSDAIAGVVNFILKDDFEGASASMSYGAATRGGHDIAQADIAVGTSWGTGSSFISYSYSDTSALDSKERDFSDIDPTRTTTLIPEAQTRGAFASIQQSISDRTNVSGGVFHSTRNSSQRATGLTRGAPFAQLNNGDQEQLFISAELEHEVFDSIFAEIDFAYVDYEQERFLATRIAGRNNSDRRRITGGHSIDVIGKVDGPVFALPGGELRFSTGGGYSRQEYKTSGFVSLPNTIDSFTNLERDSYFAFAEGFAPIVSPDQNLGGVHRFELSGAARYTHYSDFGGDWTPRLGVLYSPIEGLNFRATYSRSFRAPSLSETDPNSSGAQTFSLVDRGFPDTFSNDGSSVVLRWVGSGSDLTPEFSDTYTVGFDVEPAGIRGLRISGTYFHIDYTDRLGTVDFNQAQLDQIGFAFAYNPSPTLDDFAAIVATNPFFFDRTGLISDVTDPAAIADVVTVIADFRLRNLAESVAEGVDIAIDYDRDLAIGDASYGLRLTQTLTSSDRAFSAAPETIRLDTVGNPVSLRFNAYAGLATGPWSGRISAYYIDGYMNGSVIPDQSIDSWITTDLSIRYAPESSQNALLKDLALSLTINNLFDSDPPFVQRQDLNIGLDGLTREIGYDPVNANPVGRFVTLGLRKQF